MYYVHTHELRVKIFHVHAEFVPTNSSACRTPQRHRKCPLHSSFSRAAPLLRQVPRCHHGQNATRTVASVCVCVCVCVRVRARVAIHTSAACSGRSSSSAGGKLSSDTACGRSHRGMKSRVPSCANEHSNSVCLCSASHASWAPARSRSMARLASTRQRARCAV